MNTRTLLVTSALGLVMMAGAAHAQTPIPEAPKVTPPVAPTAPSQRPEDFGRFLERGQSVLERPRPEYDPLGIRLGSFFLYPKAELNELYNDNIFATRRAKKDDFITVLSPVLDLRSNWSNHELDVRGGASVGTYAKNPGENYGDYFVQSQGRLDITRYLAALGGAKYEHLHEERDSPDTTVGTAHPVEFDVYTGTVGLAQRGLRIGWETDFDVRREDYNNQRSATGVLFNESVRDVNVYSPSARVSYEFAPRYQAFVRGAGEFRRYDHVDTGVLVAGVPQKRDSDGFRIDAGARIDLTGITYAEVFAGYVEQDYKARSLGSISGIDFGTRVVWNVTELTSVTVDGSRRVQDANTFAQGAASPGYLRSTVTLGVDHELLRNLLLHGEAQYQNDDYQGINRTDDRFDIGAGAKYLFTRNLYFGGSYTFTTRSSSGTAASGGFDRNLFLVRLGAQL
jgi:hypothetical protein